MYAGFLYQREVAKADWYRKHNQEPPNLGFVPKQIKRKMIDVDTRTYTKTYKMNPYDPIRSKKSDENENSSTKKIKREMINDKLSLWEGEGAGIEPIEFFNTLGVLREDKCLNPKYIKSPPVGRLNNCFTPYENDIMSFDAFEAVRKELKNRSEHIANEMKRVEKEWNRPPKSDWFTYKDERFTFELCRFNELSRRNAMKKLQKCGKKPKKAQKVQYGWKEPKSMRSAYF